MKTLIVGKIHLLGEKINTDLHCSTKYLPGKDSAYAAKHAFDGVSPGFATSFATGDVIVAGSDFGINSSREQAIQVLRLMGVAAVIAPSFGRQFFRNAINNGLSLVEAPIEGLSQGDEVSLDLQEGQLKVEKKSLVRSFSALPTFAQAILNAGGLIPFLEAHPDWSIH
jgi:3-isopropylmalate dehydratase small subunit